MDHVARFALVALALSAGGCGAAPADVSVDAGFAAQSDAAHDEDVALGPGCATTPSYAQLRDTIFAPHCATGRCHGGTDGPPPDHGPSNFTSTSTRLSFVDRESVHHLGLVLVRPGDPEGSFLMAKLTNDLPSDPRIEGVAMPPATRTGWTPLSDDDIELIRCWIAGGAP